MSIAQAHPVAGARRLAAAGLGAIAVMAAAAGAHAQACNSPVCFTPGPQTNMIGTATRSGTGNFVPISIWNMGGGNFDIAFTLPIVPTQLTFSTAANAAINQPPINFLTLANGAAGAYKGKAGGWSFAPAANPLPNGTLTVTSYAVYAGPGYVGIAHPGTARGFSVSVNAADAPAGNLHWVQVIADNFNITSNPGWGNSENVLDITAANTTPYYDVGGAANAASFYDAPSRTNPANITQNDWWLGDLFLATGPGATRSNTAAPGAVTIYNTGIQYGWANVHLSVGALFTLKGLRQTFGSYTSSATNLDELLDCDPATCPLNSEFTPTFLADLDEEFDASIPEPGAWALFIAGAGLVGAAARRRRALQP
jgi:hypothetical protein